VQQTTGETLPKDFGLAESQLRLGHVDAVVPRGELTETLARLLALFTPPPEVEEEGVEEPAPEPAPGAFGWLRRLLGRSGG
jgi:acetyl-CoA carboxylase beta subunit